MVYTVILKDVHKILNYENKKMISLRTVNKDVNSLAAWVHEEHKGVIRGKARIKNEQDCNKNKKEEKPLPVRYMGFTMPM